VLTALGLALAWLGTTTAEAVTVSFLTLALGQIAHVFNMAGPESRPWVNTVSRNRWVWGAVVLCVGLVFAGVEVPWLAEGWASSIPDRPVGRSSRRSGSCPWPWVAALRWSDGPWRGEPFNVRPAMTVSRILPLLAVSLAVACGQPDEQPLSGRQLYRTYCASCHGVDGRGGGPAAPALRAEPTDLTRLEARGAFDESRIMAVIDGRRQVDAHGSRVMPVWGGVFVSELDTLRYTEYTTLLRTRDLMEYLRSIQRPTGEPPDG